MPFIRFQGLTRVERYAEVLAHELAHAQYFLESPERLVQLAAARGTVSTFLSGTERAMERVPQELGRRLQDSLAALTASEAHAESLEAVVLNELAGRRPSPTAMGQVQ